MVAGAAGAGGEAAVGLAIALLRPRRRRRARWWVRTWTAAEEQRTQGRRGRDTCAGAKRRGRGERQWGGLGRGCKRALAQAEGSGRHPWAEGVRANDEQPTGDSMAAQADRAIAAGCSAEGAATLYGRCCVRAPAALIVLPPIQMQKPLVRWRFPTRVVVAAQRRRELASEWQWMGVGCEGGVGEVR